MILTCPACSASYMVPSEAIGDRGRDVRCKKCAHTWFQKSEKDSLDELISRIQASDVQEDEISFGDSSGFKRFGDRKAKGEPLLKRLKVKIKAKFSGIFKENPLIAKIKQPFSKIHIRMDYVSAGAVAIAIFSLVLLGLVSFRTSLAGAIQSLRPVYITAGFPLESYANVNPEEALILERTELITDAGERKINTNLINLTSSEVLIPKFGITYMDAHGQVLKVEEQKASQLTLKKESSLSVSFPVEKSIPTNISTVEIRFVE